MYTMNHPLFSKHKCLDSLTWILILLLIFLIPSPNVHAVLSGAEVIRNASQETEKILQQGIDGIIASLLDEYDGNTAGIEIVLHPTLESSSYFAYIANRLLSVYSVCSGLTVGGRYDNLFDDAYYTRVSEYAKTIFSIEEVTRQVEFRMEQRRVLMSDDESEFDSQSPNQYETYSEKVWSGKITIALSLTSVPFMQPEIDAIKKDVRITDSRFDIEREIANLLIQINLMTGLQIDSAYPGVASILADFKGSNVYNTQAKQFFDAQTLPYSRATITSAYGWRILYDEMSFHRALDFGVDKNTPIPAIAAGVVVYTFTGIRREGIIGDGYGNYVILFHGKVTGKDIYSLYAHQTSVSVKVGQKVGRGDTIGYVGSTGNSTGYHLHLELLMEESDSYKAVDPLFILQ